MAQFLPARLHPKLRPSSELSENAQLWLFSFPKEFDSAAFADLKISIPPVPAPKTQDVTSFILKGQSYKLVEEPSLHASEYVNFFPASTESEKAFLAPGKAFERYFFVVRDLLCTSVKDKELSSVPRARRPANINQNLRSQPILQGKFLPLGYLSPQKYIEIRDSKHNASKPEKVSVKRKKGPEKPARNSKKSKTEHLNDRLKPLPLISHSF
eukprot:g45912.t1